MPMNSLRLLELLEQPQSNWHRLIGVFNEVVLPRVVSQMNLEMSPHQIAKLASEKLPENERNLTDARTRIGVLLEYSLAIYLDKLFTEEIGPEHRVGFVVAHKFPDLVARDPDHLPILRIEVKCVQLAAEEKSANLDTLLRDIRPYRDLLCVLVWEWQQRVRGKSVVQYPHVQRAFAFDAYIVAKVRDWGWLNEPKRGHTNDIDVATAVVRRAGSWKKEEKNLGKLMRIADREALTRPPLHHFANDPVVSDYLEFKDFVIEHGITLGWRRIVGEANCTIPNSGGWCRCESVFRLEIAVDSRGGTIATYFVPNMRSRAAIKTTVLADLRAIGLNSCRVVLLSEKYAWRIFEYDGTTLASTAAGKKPKNLVSHLTPRLGR